MVFVPGFNLERLKFGSEKRGGEVFKGGSHSWIIIFNLIIIYFVLYFVFLTAYLLCFYFFLTIVICNVYLCVDNLGTESSCSPDSVNKQL